MTLPAPCRAAGFTLLEILVALVVLGLLVGGLAQGSRFGMLALERSDRTINDSATLEAAERIVRGLVTEMAPGRDGGSPPLVGTVGRMSFVSGVQTARQVAVGWDGTGRLILRETGPQTPGSWEETILLEGISGVELAYWDGGWRSSWQAPTLPALMRVRIRFPAGDRRHWPDIVIRPLRERME